MRFRELDKSFGLRVLENLHLHAGFTRYDPGHRTRYSGFSSVKCLQFKDTMLESMTTYVSVRAKSIHNEDSFYRGCKKGFLDGKPSKKCNARNSCVSLACGSLGRD